MKDNFTEIEHRDSVDFGDSEIVPNNSVDFGNNKIVPNSMFDVDEDAEYYKEEGGESIQEMAHDIERQDLKSKLKEKKELQRIENQLYGESGLKGKLFWVNKAGENELYYTIDDIGAIPDLEIYIMQTIKSNDDWPGGKWLLKVVDSKGAYKKQLRYNFAEKPSIKKEPENKIAEAALRQNQLMTDKFMDLLQANRVEGSGQEALIELIRTSSQKDTASEFAKLAEVMKAMNPPKQESESTKALLLAVVPVIGKLIEKLMEPKPQGPSLMEQIAVMKEAGLISPSNPQGAFNEALTMFTNVMQITRDMAPASESPISEILKQVGPHIGQTLSNVTQGINNFLQIKRESIALQAQALQGRVKVAEGNVIEHNPAMPEANTIGEEPMHPTMQEIHNAAMSNDTEYYSKLKNHIISFAGNDTYDGLIAGTIDPEAFVGQLVIIAPQFGKPEVKVKMVEYLMNFVLSEQRTGLVKGTCPKCGLTYEATPADFNENGLCGNKELSGKICDGQLIITDLDAVVISETPKQEADV